MRVVARALEDGGFNAALVVYRYVEVSSVFLGTLFSRFAGLKISILEQAVLTLLS